MNITDKIAEPDGFALDGSRAIFSGENLCFQVFFLGCCDVRPPCAEPISVRTVVMNFFTPEFALLIYIEGLFVCVPAIGFETLDNVLGRRAF